MTVYGFTANNYRNIKYDRRERRAKLMAGTFTAVMVNIFSFDVRGSNPQLFNGASQYRPQPPASAR